eukprot:TRINITY_DN2055_c0_g1_i5.p1 TRINITY_DN2055_c0_g1~~TRINITY_DN2055_c0_g1_i5.p1  ORF type:complete len:123 (+),score=10.33 TRINITY_DN2055_c0_g1_i5:431-799(+)
MTTLGFFGSFLTAFGPLLGMFVFSVMPKNKRIVLMVASCFFCLLGISTAALFWYIVSPMKETYSFVIPFSVFFQEIARYQYISVYRWSEKRINKIANVLHLGIPNLGTTLGKSFSFMSYTIN